MVSRLVIPTADTFDDMLDNGSYTLASAIVESILKQIPTDKDILHIVEVYVEEEDGIYDLSVEKDDIIETLQENLVWYEQEENYEGCATIAKAIETLRAEA